MYVIELSYATILFAAMYYASGFFITNVNLFLKVWQATVRLNFFKMCNEKKTAYIYIFETKEYD